MPQFRGKAEKLVNSIMSIGQAVKQGTAQLSSADLKRIRENVRHLDKLVSNQMEATEKAESVKKEQDRLKAERAKKIAAQDKAAKAKQDDG